MELQPVSPDDALVLARRICSTVARLTHIVEVTDWPKFKDELVALYEVAVHLTELVGVEAVPENPRQIM